MHADRRHLSRFDVFVDGARLSSLAVATPSPSSSVVVHRLRDERGVERPAIIVRRRRLGGTLHEDIELWATGRETITVSLAVGVAADFAHLFDVKAGRARPVVTPTADVHGFEFQDPDGTATTTVRWNQTPDDLDGDAGHVRWTLVGAAWSTRGGVDRRLTRTGGTGRRRAPVVPRRRPLRPPPPSGLGQSGAERHVDGRTLVRGRRSSPRRPRRAPHPRCRPPRPGRRRSRCTVVHDAVRPRLTDHVVDAVAVRPCARVGCPVDARRAPGHAPRADRRGGTRQDPARGAHARRRRPVRVPWPLLRQCRRHPPLRRHGSRGVAMGRARRRDAGDVGAGHRTGGRLDPTPPARRRTGHLSTSRSPRSRQSGLEGLLGRCHVRRRLHAARSDRPGRGAGLRVRGPARRCRDGDRRAAPSSTRPTWSRTRPGCAPASTRSSGTRAAGSCSASTAPGAGSTR